MAWLKKQRAREPLANARIPMFSLRKWTGGTSLTETKILDVFDIEIMGESGHRYTLTLARHEAEQFAAFIQQHKG